MLAWYRARDDRPWFVDNALCWARLATGQGPKWALLHLAKNPMSGMPSADTEWHEYLVFDAPSDSFFWFDRPPKNRDIDRFSYFHFHLEGDANWAIYDSSIDERAWSAALGEKPDRHFSR